MSGDTGGESTLVDGLAAAYRFRQLTPQYFHDLTTCNATFVKQRRGAHMTYCRPHIVLKAEDASSDVDREIVSIHWAPPFEGPLLISPEKISSYYRAYAAFELLVDDTKSYMHTSQLNHELSLYAKEYTWQYRLQPGDMLIFNNARMLHGRRGFQTDESCTRLLIGGYTGMDDTLNRFRLLLNGRKMETYPNIGNGTTSFIP
jgi:gamma-butyrobetaine dioxygenase